MSRICRLEYTEGLNQGLEAAEASDSGDSLFLTQNPVTKPVRPPRPSRHGKRSDLAPLEDSEVESSSSSSQGESRTPTRTPRRNRRLPSYTFRFLSGNTREDGSASPEVALPAQKNRILHTFAVTGFFKCLSEFDTKTSLPTVDTDEEDLSPLSEEEEEESRTQPFRVVDKRRFVTALKTASSQTWGGQRRKDRGYPGGSTSRDVPPAWSSDNAAPSVGKRSRKPEEVEERSDPGVCGDGGWEGDHQTGRGETGAPLSHGYDQSVGSDTRKQTHASVEEQRREEPEDPSVLESSAPEGEPGTTGEAEPNERSLHEVQEDRPEERTSRKRRKKKKHKSKSAAPVRDDHLESDAVTTDAMIPSEGGGENKKTDGGDDVAANDGADGGPRPKRRKTKKHTKERRSPPRDAAAAAAGEEAGDARDPDAAAAREGRTGKSHKKTRVFREEGERTTASTDGPPEVRLAEPKRKKHKATTDASGDGVAQSDCSEAVWKEEGERAPIPFEVSDAGSAEIAGSSEQPDRRVKKKNGKRNRGREGAADRREEREKEGEGSGDGVVTAADATEGAGVREETPGKRTEKGKNGGTELLTDSALSEFREKKKKKRADAPLTSHTPISESPPSSSERAASKKRHKLKRRLHNPLGDFLE